MKTKAELEELEFLHAAIFAETCDQFQTAITRLAELAGKPTMEVFALWRTYSKGCNSADQSALLWEFVAWYAKDLHPDVELMRRIVREHGF